MSVNIICIDNDAAALRRLMQRTRQLVPDATVHGCNDPGEAVSLTDREGCDVLLTDIDLGRSHIDGFMLAERIQRINPRVNIIFLTECDEEKYGVEAYRLHASGYLLKPYSSDALAEEFAHLRYKTV